MDTLEIFFLFFSLFLIGTMFGSFSSVLIARWKSGETGICTGRSACPHCKHILGPSELIPIFSFLFQKGKCKHCKVKIPYFYPLLELMMGGVFVLMGYLGIYTFHLSIFSVAFFFLIFLGFLTIVYIFYDLKYMEIPDEIFIIFIIGNFILFILSFFLPHESVYFNIQINHTFHTYIENSFFGALILYTFLYIQIFISGALFFIKKQQYRDIFGLFGWYFLFPFMAVWDFFRIKVFHKKPLQEETNADEVPFWVGPGDLFLAIIIGWTLGVIHGIAAFFFAYIAGSIVGCIILCFLQKEKNGFQVPFGPFLGIGFFLALIFYQQINNFVNTYFLF